MADNIEEKDSDSPSIDQLRDLKARYDAITQGIANPILPAALMAPGSGVLLPPSDSSLVSKQSDDDDSDKSVNNDGNNLKDDSDSDNDNDLTDDDSEDESPVQDKQQSSDSESSQSERPLVEDPVATLVSNPPSNINKMLQDAIDKRDRKSMIADLLQAGDLIGSGLAGRNGSIVKTLPESYYAGMKEQANKPIEDFKAKMAIQGDDPNSEASQTARALGAQVGINFPPTATANSIHQALPVLATFQAKQDATEQRRQAAIEKSKDRQVALEAARINAQSKQQDKSSDQQNKALTSAQQLLESARGNPAAAQAEKDLYSAEKANSLVNLYGDPDKLSLPQVKLLASEVGKIASGGVSTQSELEGITPNTLTGRLSQYTSNLTNNPTPANAAAFVKQYQDYTKALAKDAKKVIHDKYGRIIETRKAQLGDDNYNALKDQYLNRFDNETDKESAPSKQPFNSNDPKDLAAVQTIMKNNPGVSLQDAIDALSKHKKDQGY